MKLHLEEAVLDSSLNSGVCLFYVEGEPDVYDSEPIILVDFTRNLAVADCEENRLLDGKGSEKSELEFTSIQEKILSSQVGGEMMPYLTRYSFSTGIDGNFSVQQHPLLNPPPLGCPIPRDLSLPTINISQLRRISSWTGMNSFHLIHIDPDECDTYIFKHIPAEDLIRAPEGAIKRRSHALLSEVELLTTGALAKSPFVAKPSLVVVDDSNILRGYLIPYEIEMALGKLLDDCGGLPDKHMVLLDAEVSNRDEIPPCFTWETKLAWAIGVVEGLADMHASGICHGDLTTFAIDLSQGCKIVYNSIDFGFSLVYTAPEYELNMMSGEPKEPLETLLTPTRDVFALGLVLWSISEEIYMFLRMPNLKPRLLWADDGRTPEWYRELVEACVDSDPNQRPDVDSVLNELVAHI